MPPTPLLDYVQALIAATRSGRWFLRACARAPASPCCAPPRRRRCSTSRDYVAPDDVQAVLPQTVAHRLIPVGDAGRGRVEQVRAMIEAVPLP